MSVNLSMNSVQISEQLIKETDSRIETLRKFEANKLRTIDDLDGDIDELQERLDALNIAIDRLKKDKKKAQDSLDQIRARKKSLLINKQALMAFIESGGGLDMYV